MSFMYLNDLSTLFPKSFHVHNNTKQLYGGRFLKKETVIRKSER